jgi:hypothetical protein
MSFLEKVQIERCYEDVINNPLSWVEVKNSVINEVLEGEIANKWKTISAAGI